MLPSDHTLAAGQSRTDHVMKNRYVLLADLPLVAIAAFGAFAGRFDWLFYQERPEFLPYLLAALVVKPSIFMALGMYRRCWQYASIAEMALVFVSVTASSVALAILIAVSSMLDALPPWGFSRVVVFNDWILTLAMVGGLRLTIRFIHEASIPQRGEAGARRRTLIAALVPPHNGGS